MLMKPSLQKPGLATRWKFILKKNEIHKHIKNNDIDIENINTFEKRNKVNTTQWRKIYEVIEPEFFYKSDIFQMVFKNS